MRAHPVPVARPRGHDHRAAPTGSNGLSATSPRTAANGHDADGDHATTGTPSPNRYESATRATIRTGPVPPHHQGLRLRRVALTCAHLGQASRAARTTRALPPTARRMTPQGRRRRRGRSASIANIATQRMCPPPDGATAATPWRARRRGPLPHQPRRRPVRLRHDGPDGHARRRQHVPGALLPQPLAAVAGLHLASITDYYPRNEGQYAGIDDKDTNAPRTSGPAGRGVEPGEAPRELLPAVRGRARQEDALLRGHEPRAVPARLDAHVQVPRLQRRLGARALRHQRRRRRRRRLRLRHVLGPRARPRHVGAADRRWKPLQRVLFFRRSDTQRAQAATQTQPPTTQAPNPNPVPNQVVHRPPIAAALAPSALSPSTLAAATLAAPPPSPPPSPPPPSPPPPSPPPPLAARRPRRRRPRRRRPRRRRPRRRRPARRPRRPPARRPPPPPSPPPPSPPPPSPPPPAALAAAALAAAALAAAALAADPRRRRPRRRRPRRRRPRRRRPRHRRPRRHRRAAATRRRHRRPALAAAALAAAALAAAALAAAAVATAPSPPPPSPPPPSPPPPSPPPPSHRHLAASPAAPSPPPPSPPPPSPPPPSPPPPSPPPPSPPPPSPPPPSPPPPSPPPPSPPPPSPPPPSPPPPSPPPPSPPPPSPPPPSPPPPSPPRPRRRRPRRHRPRRRRPRRRRPRRRHAAAAQLPAAQPWNLMPWRDRRIFGIPARSQGHDGRRPAHDRADGGRLRQHLERDADQRVRELWPHRGVARAAPRLLWAATNSPPPAPPPEDRIPDVERPFFFDEDGVRVDIPQVARANGLTAHFTTTTGFRMRYILAEGLAERYTLAGKARGDPEKMPNAYFHRAACGDEEATLVKVHVRLLLQPWAQGVDARTDFFMRVYGGTLDAAFRRFDVRSCFTETTENVRLECDPAPSPPPPDNWQKPPSPPAYVYEALTLATATGVVGALLRDQRGVLPRRRRPRHPRAAQLAPHRRARPARRQHALQKENARHGHEPTRPFGPTTNSPARAWRRASALVDSTSSTTRCVICSGVRVCVCVRVRVCTCMCVCMGAYGRACVRAQGRGCSTRLLLLFLTLCAALQMRNSCITHNKVAHRAPAAHGAEPLGRGGVGHGRLRRTASVAVLVDAMAGAPVGAQPAQHVHLPRERRAPPRPSTPTRSRWPSPTAAPRGAPAAAAAQQVSWSHGHTPPSPVRRYLSASRCPPPGGPHARLLVPVATHAPQQPERLHVAVARGPHGRVAVPLAPVGARPRNHLVVPTPGRIVEAPHVPGTVARPSATVAPPGCRHAQRRCTRPRPRGTGACKATSRSACARRRRRAKRPAR